MIGLFVLLALVLFFLYARERALYMETHPWRDRDRESGR